MKRIIASGSAIPSYFLTGAGAPATRATARLTLLQALGPRMPSTNKIESPSGYGRTQVTMYGPLVSHSPPAAGGAGTA